MVILLGSILAGCRSSGNDFAAAGQPSDPSAYAGGNLLISALQLYQRLDDPTLRIVDLSPIRDYRDGHVPHAVHLWWQDTIEIHNDIFGMLADEATRARLIEQAGITDQHTVVLYDANGNRYAARFLWLLNAIGFENVAVLNGGRQAWQAAGYPLSDDEPSPAPGHLVQDLNYEVLTDYGLVSERLGDGSFTIVDNRTPEERAETWYGRLREGRIPGAALIPWTELVRPGPIPYYRSPAELDVIFRSAGVTPEKPVIVYGISTIEAAATYLVLKLLGYPSVIVYEGSWAEWSAHPEFPVEPLPSSS